MKKIACIGLVIVFGAVLMSGCMEKDPQTNELETLSGELDEMIEKVKFDSTLKQVASLDNLGLPDGTFETDGKTRGAWKQKGDYKVVVVYATASETIDLFTSLQSGLYSMGYSPVERMECGEVAVHYKKGEEDVYLILRETSVMLIQG